jgi:uncharacterized protein YmfQ (DUF2313 family)
MAVNEAITRTLRRIGDVAHGLLGGETLGKLYAGLSAEFARVAAQRDIVLDAMVPHSEMGAEALDDLEVKYGLSYFSDISEDDRIARLIERAADTGSGGPAWLQAQIQAAGFPLYVLENDPQLAETTQFGDVEFGEATQFGEMPKYVDPATVAGILITSSPNRRSGARLLSSSQFSSTNQFGDGQFGTRDPAYAYPQPAERQLPTDPQKWPKIFFLSPFPDRLATSSEVLYLSDGQIQYLKRLVMQIKYLRNWCIAQIAEDVIMVDFDDAILTWSDDSIWRA